MTIQNADLQKEIIARVHGDHVDPNALLLVWRNEAERKAKAGGLPATFLRGRQEALERYAREVDGSADAPRLTAFYATKLKENGGLLDLLEGKGDSSEIEAKANALWQNVAETLAYLEAQLDVKAPYLLGDQVSLAECVGFLLGHTSGWWSRQSMRADLPSPRPASASCVLSFLFPRSALAGPPFLPDH